MEEINGSTGQQTHQPLFHLLDPISLIMHQNSSFDQPFPLRLTTDSYIMERGPRYSAYAELRESKLKLKSLIQQESEVKEKPTAMPPLKKQVKFQGVLGNRLKGGSVLTQSVPDFSSVLRKENRKPPATMLPTMMEMTPPSKSWSKMNGVLTSSRGSKSANAGEKRGGGGGLMARKSYASVEELKGLSSAAANAISGENRGGRSGRGMGKTVLGYRQF